MTVNARQAGPSGTGRPAAPALTCRLESRFLSILAILPSRCPNGSVSLLHRSRTTPAVTDFVDRCGARPARSGRGVPTGERRRHPDRRSLVAPRRPGCRPCRPVARPGRPAVAVIGVLAPECEVGLERGRGARDPHLPDAVTQGEDREGAIAMAADCLAETIGARIAEGADIPGPSVFAHRSKHDPRDARAVLRATRVRIVGAISASGWFRLPRGLRSCGCVQAAPVTLRPLRLWAQGTGSVRRGIGLSASDSLCTPCHRPAPPRATSALHGILGTGSPGRTGARLFAR